MGHSRHFQKTTISFLGGLEIIVEKVITAHSLTYKSMFRCVYIQVQREQPQFQSLRIMYEKLDFFVQKKIIFLSLKY